MNTFDPVLETRIIKTILEQKDSLFLINLSSDWFGLPTTREIWERISSLKANGKQIPKTITFASDPVLSEDARTLLQGDVEPFDASDSEQAMEQLNHYRQGRVISAMAKKVVDLMSDPQGDIAQAKQVMERSLAALQNADFSQDFLTYGYESFKALDFYDTVMNKNLADRFMKTGFSFIDSQQGGLGRGRLYTLGAPSGGGKSTLGNQLGVNMYLGGISPFEVFHKKKSPLGCYSVSYNSFELGREECLLRTQANATRIPHDRFQLQNLSPAERTKSDRIYAQLLAHGEAYNKRLEYNCPSKDINTPQLISMIEPLSFDVVIVDYINLMAPINPKEGLWWNIGEAFRLWKRFAERTRCAVIMLVQVDEETKDIKYAKSIRHHSDGVWVWDYGDVEKETGIIEIKQTKLRNFKPGNFNLAAEFEFCAFNESHGMGADSSNPTSASIPPMNL
jgi:replicative DNA helicase